MLKKYYYLILNGLLLVFAVVMAVLFSMQFPIKTEAGLIFYTVEKVFALIALVGTTALFLLRKSSPSTVVWLTIATTVFQFLPLSTYFLINKENPNFLLPVVILFLFMIFYVSFVFGFFIFDQKAKKADDSLKAKSIPVKDE